MRGFSSFPVLVESDPTNMQTDAAGSRSVVTDGNSLHTALFSLGYSDSVDRQSQNHVMAGFPLPLTLGEALVNFTCGQISTRVAVANSDEFWNTQPGSDTIRDFSIGTSYPQISSIQDMEGIPLPDAYVTTPLVARHATSENHEKLTTSGPFVYPFECPKAVVDSNSSVVNSTFESTNYSYEGLPFDASTRWDFNKFITPPELVGRVVGRMGVQPGQSAGNSVLNEWIITEQGDLNSNNPGSSRFSNELSLSLATSQPSVVHGTSIQEQCSEMSSSGVTHYSLHKRHIGSEHTSCSSNNLSLSFNSHKPLQVSPLLSGSRFFHAMQEILAEIACCALEKFEQMSYSATGIDNGVKLSFSSSCTAGRGCSAIGFSDGLDVDHRFLFQNNLMQEREVEAKKIHLLSLLQVVDDQYNQCLDEIHTVISAFHAVTELDPNLHARFALPTISLMYKNLRERISSHILAMGGNLSEGEAREDNSFETSFIQKQWALQQLRKRDHQLWRPQRGLPERSVSVLRAWMFRNFLHPYPKDAEKHLLALKSGLTRSQVSNWFINARVRLWKPMIEEMYAEMNRRKACRNDEETNATHRNHMLYENRRFTMD
ncbi:hypothetical protein Pfo_024800 [Paulownia fortunei]|nr:hypothetical protein Pfo_024800 [Paulownia fortunei]